MTTQDLINTLKQGKPMTERLAREIVRELEGKAALVGDVKKMLAVDGKDLWDAREYLVARAAVVAQIGGE